jgi:hypothetical protein
MRLSRQHVGMTKRYCCNARGVRDRQALERVCLQADALFAAGHSQAQDCLLLGRHGSGAGDMALFM